MGSTLFILIGLWVVNFFIDYELPIFYVLSMLNFLDFSFLFVFDLLVVCLLILNELKVDYLFVNDPTLIADIDLSLSNIGFAIKFGTDCFLFKELWFLKAFYKVTAVLEKPFFWVALTIFLMGLGDSGFKVII